MTSQVRLLILVAVLLAGVKFADVWLGREMPEPVAKAGVVAAPDLASVLSINPIALEEQARFEALWSKPLFTPSRKAMPAGALAPGTAPATDPAPEVQPPKLRGTIALPTPGAAFLTGADGQSVFLHQGEEIDGWRLQQVGDGWVNLTGARGTMRLSLPGAVP